MLVFVERKPGINARDDVKPAPLQKAARGYFRSVWTVAYRFWGHLIWAHKLGKPGEKNFCESKHEYFE